MKAQVRIRSCGSADICAELRGPLRASRHQALRLPLLREDGLELTEVAPGIDSEADILSRLPFSATAFDPKPMNGALFRTALARFRGRIRDIGIDRRISCNAQTNTPFLDYSGMRVISESDLEKI